MDFAKWDYPSSDACLYRAVEKNKANKDCSPWGAKAMAFKRRASDLEGLSLFSSAEMCWTLNIGTVVRVQVRAINSIYNGHNNQPLTVIQDSPEHAFIANVPAFGSDEISINDAALQLLIVSESLEESEWNRAKLAGLEIRRRRTEAPVTTQEAPQENQPRSGV
jgi:hypothetical protein